MRGGRYKRVRIIREKKRGRERRRGKKEKKRGERRRDGME